jgi:hypothetical protein
MGVDIIELLIDNAYTYTEKWLSIVHPIWCNKREVLECITKYSLKRTIDWDIEKGSRKIKGTTSTTEESKKSVLLTKLNAENRKEITNKIINSVKNMNNQAAREIQFTGYVQGINGQERSAFTNLLFNKKDESYKECVSALLEAIGDEKNKNSNLSLCFNVYSTKYRWDRDNSLLKQFWYAVTKTQLPGPSKSPMEISFNKEKEENDVVVLDDVNESDVLVVDAETELTIPKEVVPSFVLPVYEPDTDQAIDMMSAGDFLGRLASLLFWAMQDVEFVLGNVREIKKGNLDSRERIKRCEAIIAILEDEILTDFDGELQLLLKLNQTEPLFNDGVDYYNELYSNEEVLH